MVAYSVALLSDACSSGSALRAGRLARTALAMLACGSLGFGAGCNRQDAIRHYRVPKEQTLLRDNGPDASETAGDENAKFRMLAAIIPRDPQAWFVRMLGPAETVEAEAANFRALVKSIHFTGEGTPEWTLPQGWQQKPASGMRYATIEVPSAAGALDLSVTVLPKNEPDPDVYALSNVNRWRGQLGLPPLAPGELKNNVEQVELTGTSATLVDLVGHKPQDNMGRAPFAGGAMPPSSPAPNGPGASAGPRRTARELTYDVPSGWTEGPAGGMRKAAFAVGTGAESGEVTIISLDASGGALLPNINRWRQQVGLPETSADDLAHEVKKIELGDVAGDFIDLAGAEKAILGVVAQHGGQTWFIKMTGSPALVAREKQNFETFARSVRFTAP
ncbi:MAG TPA: hypothetical protein VHD36_04835 [Pirellulales bacterium]|nr:hypothetical protein [Pirellulales bacterium]